MSHDTRILKGLRQLAAAKPAAPLSVAQIATACKVSESVIRKIEKKATEHVRRRLQTIYRTELT